MYTLSKNQVQPKHIQFLLVKHTSVKLEKILLYYLLVCLRESLIVDLLTFYSAASRTLSQARVLYVSRRVTEL